MIGLALNWLITSRLGQTIILAAAISATAFLVHWYVDSKAYARGITDCTAQHAAATAQANLEQAAREKKQREGASEIAKDTDTAVVETVTELETASNETKEIIRYVYRDPPTPTAVACVPSSLDPRVQERIDRAVDASNGS